ncbi:MAG: ATP-binding protein [Blastocatellia bacterium]
MKFFNTAGPCDPTLHYMIPAARRLSEYDVMRMIGQQSYFVLHAPRQVGKTTVMTQLARTLTESGKYAAALVSMETGAGMKSDLGLAESAILNGWRAAIEDWLPVELLPPPWPDAPAGHRIGSALSAWAESAPRPLVIFLDDIEDLEDQTLVSILCQLRSGFNRRPEFFPASLAMIGWREGRNHRMMYGGRVPFNVVERSLTLPNFRPVEVKELLAEHTAETGQVFTGEALQAVFNLTQGQPWLVNALAKVCVEELVEALTLPVNARHIEQAEGILIKRCETHLNQLANSLIEGSVRRVIDPMLAGEIPYGATQDEFEYVVDLGLCRKERGCGLEIANPIYHEVITSALR